MEEADDLANADGVIALGVPDVLVELHIAGASRDERLQETIARFTDEAVQDVIVSRLCQRCGSTDHGVPASPGVVVSRARSGGLELTAVAARGRLGVDLEQVARVATGAADAVLIHPLERAWLSSSDDPGRDRAALWVAKEAVVKALGLGLVVEPSSFALAWDKGDLVVEQAPDWLGIGSLRIRIFDVTPDLIGALAILPSNGG